MLRALFNSFFLYILGVALLPLLYIPFISVEADLQKSIVSGIFLGALMVALGGILFFVRQRPTLLPPLLSLAGVPLMVVAVSSALWHGLPVFSFVGLGFDIGTLASFGLCMATAISASLLNKEHIRIALRVFVIATAVVAGISTVSVGIGYGMPALFSAWPHLSFLIAGALLIALIQYDVQSGAERWGYAAATVWLGVLFLCFYHQTVVLALLCALALFVVMRFLLAPFEGIRRIPLLSIGALLLLGVLLFFGFRSFFSLPPDVRLTAEATRIVGSPVYLGSLSGALLGSGPDTFSVAWERFRPAAFNQTTFWQTTFREGYSTAYTWFVTLGWLGMLAFAYIPAALMWTLIKRVVHGRKDLYLQNLLPASTAFVFFVFIGACLYTIDMPLFLMSAATFGFCARLLAVRTPSVSESRPVVRIGGSMITLLAGAVVFVVACLQLVAASEHARGIVAFEASNPRGAEALLVGAASKWPASLYARDASRGVLELVRLEARGANADSDTIKKGIAEVRRLAREATVRAPNDFSMYFSEGSILTTLVIAGVVDFESDAAAAFNSARRLSPTRPEIPYLQAILAQSVGSTTKATVLVQDALALKSDYEPAVALLKQLQGQ